MSNDGQSKVKGVVDIVFLIDATGSMAPCIDQLKANVGTFIDTLTASGANNPSPVRDWRAKVVGYRDFESSEAEPLVDNPFVADAASLKAQLQALAATGGADEPESLLDAIYLVADIPETPKGDPPAQDKWRYKSEAARVIVIFTDASFKPQMTVARASGGSLEDVKNICHAKRIILSVFAPDMPCYDDLSQIQRSEYHPIAGSNPQQALADFTRDQANFKQTLDQLARTVSKSAQVEVL